MLWTCLRSCSLRGRSMRETLVISFFTHDTPYEEEAERLRASCKAFQIKHHIEGVPSRGSWLKNVAMKPQFIYEKLIEFQRPLFWVDADGAFKMKPQFEQFYPFDLAVREVPTHRNDRWLKLAASSIFFNSTPETIDFAKRWAERTVQKIDEDPVNLFFVDQTSLLEMIEGSPHLQVGKLPLSYCKVFDDVQQCSEVVIEQYQASRRLIDLV